MPAILIETENDKGKPPILELWFTGGPPSTDGDPFVKIAILDGVPTLNLCLNTDMIVATGSTERIMALAEAMREACEWMHTFRSRRAVLGWIKRGAR